MKKVVALVLALSLVVFGSSMAFASEIDISVDNLGRGAGVADVTNADDGSITSAKSNISFYLPAAVPAGDTVTVNIKGSSDGDFRVWLIDVNEVTNSNIFKASENGFTSGDFDFSFDLTATGESTELFFKAPSWDAAINNLTIDTLEVLGLAEDGEVAVEDGEDEDADEFGEDEVEEVVEDDAEEAAAEDDAAEEAATEAPKTGVQSNAVVYMSLMGLAAIGLVVAKKRTVQE